MSLGLQIIIPGADASDSPFPKAVSFPRGFPSQGLLATYLFEGGVAGQPFDGPFADSSGNRRTGRKFLDYFSPVRRSYGIEVSNDFGFAMDTGIEQPGEFTVIACLRHTLDVPGLGGAVAVGAWQGDTQNGAPASYTAPFTGEKRTVPGFRLGANNSQRFHSLRDSSQAQLGALQQSFTEATGGSPANMSVVAFGVSVPQSRLFWGQGATGHVFERNDPDIALGFAPQTGRNILLGLWPVAGLGPVRGQIVGFAVYEGYLRQGGWTAPAAAMAAIAQGRGVIV